MIKKITLITGFPQIVNKFVILLPVLNFDNSRAGFYDISIVFLESIKLLKISIFKIKNKIFC